MKPRGMRAFDKRGILAMRADLWGMLFGVSEPAEDYELADDIAIVKIEGPLTHHAEWFWDSYDAVKSRVCAALESPAKAVVLRIDSPGGDVAGCFEMVRELRAEVATSGKRVVAYADGMAASAGYALACIASEIFVPESAFVGSIGVISTMVDTVEMDRKFGLNFAIVASGERKRYGHPNVPISDAAVKSAQVQVDQLADIFIDLVAEARGIGAEEIAALEAGVLIGEEAVAVKLADQVCTFDELLGMLSSGATAARTAEEEAAMPGYVDEDALKKAAEEGDEKAKKILKVMEDDGEEKAEDKESEGDEPPAKDEKDAEETEKDEKAAAAAAPTTLEARVVALESERERGRLLAKRPDLMKDPALRKKLMAAPLEAVRWNVEHLPKVVSAKEAVPAAPAAKTSPLAHAGATTPAVTRGNEEGGTIGARTRRSERADELDAKLGFAKSTEFVKHERNETSIRIMKPSEARKYVKQIDARKAAEAAALNGGE